MEQTKTRPAPHPGKSQSSPAGNRPPEKKSRLTEREKQGAQTLLAILFVAGVLYLLIILIIAVCVWYSFSTPSESTALYSLRIVTEDGNIKRAAYSSSEANNSYGLYLRYSDIAPLCGFGIAGDEETVTLYLPGEGLVGSTELESIVFHRNSSLIVVNGNNVRLSAPILFEGDDYLLPVSLFETYLTGLTVEYDEEELLCLVTVPERLSFSLKLHKPTEAPKCDLTLLPEADASLEEPQAE
jgi:hypothetical protein